MDTLSEGGLAPGACRPGTNDHRRPRYDEPTGPDLHYLRGYLLRCLRAWKLPAEDLEDAAHDILLKLLAKWQTIRDPEAWCQGAVRWQCAKYWRTRGRRPYEARELDDLVELAPMPPPQFQVETRCDLGRLLHGLPQRQRQLLVLWDLRDLPRADIARQLGYSLEGLKKAHQRCLAQLRHWAALRYH